MLNHFHPYPLFTVLLSLDRRSKGDRRWPRNKCLLFERVLVVFEVILKSQLFNGFVSVARVSHQPSLNSSLVFTGCKLSVNDNLCFTGDRKAGIEVLLIGLLF